MSAGWIAAGVRGRGLARRRIGPEEARRVAACASLPDALAVLGSTFYGRDLRPGMDLPDAQHAVSASVLWHMRVLAGWGPPLGAGELRLLAAGFEIANISGRLAELAGQPVRAHYDLGSLATAWPGVSAARTSAGVRAALRSSAWGDPGSDEPPSIRLALQLAWARRVLDGVPCATDWAVAGAALVLARVVAADAGEALGPVARRDATHVVGPHWRAASSIADLARHVPDRAARALRAIDGAADLWQAESRWWTGVESDAATLAARPRPDPSAGVGTVALLAADARRVRAALAVAARGADGAGVIDAVA